MKIVPEEENGTFRHQYRLIFCCVCRDAKEKAERRARGEASEEDEGDEVDGSDPFKQLSYEDLKKKVGGDVEYCNNTHDGHLFREK